LVYVNIVTFFVFWRRKRILRNWGGREDPAISQEARFR